MTDELQRKVDRAVKLIQAAGKLATYSESASLAKRFLKRSLASTSDLTPQPSATPKN